MNKSAVDINLFMQCMDGEWAVSEHKLQEDGKLRVYYKSLVHEYIEWSHTPTTPLESIPKVGAIGRIGFIGNNTFVKDKT